MDYKIVEKETKHGTAIYGVVKGEIIAPFNWDNSGWSFALFSESPVKRLRLSQALTGTEIGDNVRAIIPLFSTRKPHPYDVHFFNVRSEFRELEFPELARIHRGDRLLGTYTNLQDTAKLQSLLYEGNPMVTNEYLEELLNSI